MDTRAAFIRIFVLLAVVCAGTWWWEFSHNNPSQPVMGEVLQVMRVGSSGTGDNREFTIRYQVRGEHYQLVTRRGLLATKAMQ